MDGKHAGDGSEGAPQVYVRLMVELSYDAPRPDADGALRRECGGHIRKEVEKALQGDMLAAKLGDARVTMRALAMRQEMDPSAFGQPVAVDVQVVTGGQPIRFSPSGPETVCSCGAGFVPCPVHLRNPRDHVDNPKGPINPKLPELRDGDGRFLAYVEDDEGTAPNAGSAS